MERRAERGRAWLITVQAPSGTDERWRCTIPNSWENKYVYRCQVYEKGVLAATIHTHILMQFKSQRRSTMLAKELIKANPGAEIDVELKRGSWEEARKYILKQDETKIKGRPPIESGKPPNNRSANNEREEAMNRLVEQIEDGGLRRVIEENPAYIIKYPSGCKLANELVGTRSEKRTILTTIVWGKAGSGKSTWVTQEALKRWDKEDIYYFSKVGGSRDTVWFNGYKGQKCLIMDDISGKSMPLEYMLKITGNDPMDVEYKGGREAAMWEEVYITSNYNPRGWYVHIFEENEESEKAFFRRINRIIHVEEGEFGSVWKIEKEEEPQIMREDFEIIPSWERTPGWIRKEREERRKDEECGMMAENDNNVLDWNRYEEEVSEETEKSGIGLQTEKVDDEMINDTPGNSMYWGGEDMALNVENCTHEEWERNWEKKEALDRYFEILKKNRIVETRGELLGKIIHGEIQYYEGDWLGDLRTEKEREREREEEMIREMELEENRGREEELEKLWDLWIWEKIRPETTPAESDEEEQNQEEIEKKI